MSKHFLKLVVSVVTIAIFCLPLKSDAKSNSGPFGLGVIFGIPTALSAKYWVDQKYAADFGFSYASNDYALFFTDYLIHFPGAFGSKQKFISQLTPYFGVGGLLAFANTDRRDDDRFLGKKNGSVGLGVRVPLGVEWQPNQPTLGVFVEFVPGISVIPQTTSIFQAGIGIRYYF